MVVLSNAARNVTDLGFHLLDRRFALAETAEPRTEVDLDPAVYDQYVGRYQLVRGVNVTVTRDGDGLFAQLTGQPRFEVFPESEDEFFLRVVDAQITFGRNDAGAVDHLVLHQNGVDQRAPRLPEGVDAVDFGPAETAAVPGAVLERYVGRYEVQPGFFIAVTRDGGQLSAQLTGQPAVPIFASSPTEFFLRGRRRAHHVPGRGRRGRGADPPPGRPRASGPAAAELTAGHLCSQHRDSYVAPARSRRRVP